MNYLDKILDAISRKDVMAIKMLTPLHVNIRDQDGMTPLMNAILEEDADPSIVGLLIERGADINASDNSEKWTALHLAARDQKDVIVRILLEAGATVDPVDVFGDTPLWRSVMNSTSSLTTIKKLVKYGADPYKKNKYGISPIDLARDIGRTDIVDIFEGKA